MFVDFSTIHVVRFPIDTDCQVTTQSWKSELAFPTRGFDHQLLVELLNGYRLLFDGLPLTAYRGCDERKQNDNSSCVGLPGE